MKVLLIFPGYTSKRGMGTLLTQPLGLMYLAAMIKKMTPFDVRILDGRVETINVKKESKKCDVIGVYADVITVKPALNIIKRFKEHNEEIISVIGGPFASAVPELIEKFDFIDFLLRGEGEYSLSKLLLTLHKKEKEKFNIPGLVFRGKKTIISIPPKLINRLDSLPFPSYELVKMERYFIRGCKRPFSSMITSRGCPYSCIFCGSHVVHGKRFRARSAENVVNEILYLNSEFNVKEIAIMDDNFTLDKKRVIKICDLITRERLDMRFSLPNGVRVETLDRKLLIKLKKCGFYKIAFGLESASANVLRLSRKQLNLYKAKKVIETTKKVGMITIGYFMLGLPGETTQSMMKTIRFAKELDLDFAFFHTVIPFPGTDLFALVEKEGKFLQNISLGIDSGYSGGEVFYVINNNVNEDLIRIFLKKANRDFYLRPWKLLKMWRYISSLKDIKLLCDACFEYLM